MSPLNSFAFAKASDMSVTSEVSQSEIAPYPDSKQLPSMGLELRHTVIACTKLP